MLIVNTVQHVLLCWRWEHWLCKCWSGGWQSLLWHLFLMFLIQSFVFKYFFLYVLSFCNLLIYMFSSFSHINLFYISILCFYFSCLHPQLCCCIKDTWSSELMYHTNKTSSVTVKSLHLTCLVPNLSKVRHIHNIPRYL